MTYCSRLIAAGLVLAGLVGLAAPARAQNNPYTWNTTDGNWNLAANWLDGLNTPAVPPSGDTTALAFAATGTTSYTAANDIGPFTLNRLTVNNAGTGTITIAGSATNTLTFAGATPTIDVTAGSVLFTGLITGAPTLTKTGAGTFIHDSNNTAFAGTLIIDGGTFVNQATVNATTEIRPTSIVVNNGGTYQFGNATVGNPNLPNGTYITVNSGGTVIWDEGEDFGGFILNGGTVDLRAGGYNGQGATAQTWNSGTLTGGAFAAAGTGTSSTINKLTSGAVTITGNARITGAGGLNIQDGTVVHVSAANLGTSNITLGNTDGTTAGTFEYQGATASRDGTFGVNAGGGTVRVTSAATTLTLTGALSGSGPLTKDGAGTLALTGALNQTGTTTVAAGTLSLNPVASAGGFSVSNGATLAVASGTGSASLTTPTLAFGGAGSTLRLDLGTSAVPTAPLVNVTGIDGLTPNGGLLNVTNTQAFPTGTFTLIDYAGAGISSGFTLQLPGRTAGSLVYDTANTRIDLTITGSDSVVWTGAVGGTWDVGTAPGVGGSNNWKLASNNNPTNFIDTDTVLFDDSTTNRTVTLNTTVQPAAVTVNTTATYTVQGTGAIAGATGLTKLGSGTLVLGTDNTYTGQTTVSAGTLQIGNGGTAGSIAGNVSLAADTTLAFNRSDAATFGGALSLGGNATLTQNGVGAVTVTSPLAVGNNTLTVGGVGELILSAPVNGAGTLTKTGAGQLTLLANSNTTFTGTLNVNGGTVLLDDQGGSGDLGATSIVVNSTGKFIFGANGNADFPDTTFITVNAGGELEFRQGETYGGTRLVGGTFRLTGTGTNGVSMSMQGTTTPFAGYSLESGTIISTDTGTGSATLNGAAGIIKTTDGTVTLTGPINYQAAMPITIEQGVMAFRGVNVPDTTGTGVVTIGSTSGAGTFRLTDAATVTVPRSVSLGEGGGVIDVADAGGRLTFGGVVTGAALSKAGPGTLTLTGANTYGGTTTVSAGTLLVNGNQSAATGSVAVTGGTLGGSGTIGGAVTVSPGGKVLAGQGAAVNEQLTLGSSLTLGNTAAIRAVIGNGTTGTDTTLATGSSQLAVAGAFGRSSASDRIIIELVPDGSTFDLSGGTTYTRRVVSGYGSLSNLNAQTYLAADNAFAVTGVGFDIANWSVIVGQGGNTVDVMFTPVPEPATVLGLAAVGLGAAGLVRRLRRVRGHGTDGQSPT